MHLIPLHGLDALSLLPLLLLRRRARGRGSAFMGNAPLSGPTAIELRSADFSPPRSSPPKTAGSGLKSALLSCRNSFNSLRRKRVVGSTVHSHCFSCRAQLHRIIALSPGIDS